jgi:hypothetical protein
MGLSALQPDAAGLEIVPQPRRGGGGGGRRGAGDNSDSDDASGSDDDDAGDDSGSENGAAIRAESPDPRDADYDSDTHAEMLALGKVGTWAC